VSAPGHLPAGETALVLVPPHDICSYADHYRELYMPDTAARVEPHVLVLYPFAPLEVVHREQHRLRAALSRIEPFYLSLRGFDTFPALGLLYMRLSHPERVVALYRAIYAEFPDYPIYGGQTGGDFTPHVAAGQFDDPAELERVHEELAGQRLFIGWTVEALTVKHLDPDGVWHTWAELPLGEQA
jgi:2'-5' RNA ligase